MKKIGIALSGGGIRGFFHAGFLHAITERQIEIHIMSGTSAGAISSALFAAGLDLKEVTDRFPRRMRSLFFEPNLLIKAKFNPTSILRKYLEDLLGDFSYSELRIPLKINAVNVFTGQTEIFHEGRLIEAVMAASAIPGVFNVFHENGNMYFDGGLTMNLPASSIRKNCDLLIGVNLLPFKQKTYTKLPGRRRLLQRAVDIYHHHNNLAQEDLCDILISPTELTKYPTYDTTNKMALFELGYQTGINLLLPI
jgi:NTE family protein